MEPQPSLAPPNNVFIDPGYYKSWTYQHLDALQYVCNVVTVYCLQPRDVCRHSGLRGIWLVRELLESGRLRVIATKEHFDLLEKADLSDIPDSRLRRETRSLARELLQRSHYTFSDCGYHPSVRNVTTDHRNLSIEYAVKKLQQDFVLKDYFSRQVARYKNQLPEFLQPDTLPRDGLLPLPEPFTNMPDDEARVCLLPYAFLGDFLVMHQADVHIPLYLHPKWSEWYFKCWENFATAIPDYKWPMQVLKIAKPSQPTKALSSDLVPAMAELIHMIKVEKRLKPEQFRSLGGLQVLQDNIWPVLINSFSAYSSVDDRKRITDSIFQTQRKHLQELFDGIGLAEQNRINIAWKVIKGVMLPLDLLLILIKVGGWPITIASHLPEGAYFLWQYRNNSKRSKKLRSAARERGIWLGLLVNPSALEMYKKMKDVEE